MWIVGIEYPFGIEHPLHGELCVLLHKALEEHGVVGTKIQVTYRDTIDSVEQIKEQCHCGRPVVYGYDGNDAHHRGMCRDCDACRCDAYPMECPYRGEQ